MKPYPIQCVSIVIPVYNEQDSLPELLRRTTAACKQLAYAYEIILVDDGSRDNSAQLLEDAAAEDGSNVVAVILNRNYGQHAAIMAGFEQCRGDVVITLDADLQNPPEEIRAWWNKRPWATTWLPPCAIIARTRPFAAGLRA